ncbi:4Fe-4S binding protein [Thermodesulfovibrionales bacterium]|nr:4Fe-4S binding protein [Thermodesulfovibrionales bacterium]
MVEAKELKVEEIKLEAERTIKCPVNKTLYYITKFLSGPMCGRCFPCAMGSFEAKIRLQNIVEGKAAELDLDALKKITTGMIEASMCKKGKDTARFIIEWMNTGVYHEHIEGRCPDMECLAFIEYVIVPDKCTMCGLCQEICKYDAIIGEKKRPYQSGYLPFEIRQKRCTKCDECVDVCPTGAVIIVEARGRELASA